MAGYRLIRIHFYSTLIIAKVAIQIARLLNYSRVLIRQKFRPDNESSLHRFLMPSRLSLIVFAIIVYCSPNTQTYPVHFASSRIASRFIEFIEPESVMYSPSFPILPIFSLFRTNEWDFRRKLVPLSLSLFFLNYYTRDKRLAAI